MDKSKTNIINFLKKQRLEKSDYKIENQSFPLFLK